MNQSTNPVDDNGNRLVENARVGYQAAITLWAYEGTTIWAKFTAMVYANTILIATFGLILTSDNASKLAAMLFALPLLGLVLCTCWYLLTVRSFDFYKHWVLSSRELEAVLSPARTVYEGGLLADDRNYSVTYKFKKGEKTTGLRKASRFAKVETVSYAVIVVFGLVYLVAIGATLNLIL